MSDLSTRTEHSALSRRQQLGDAANQVAAQRVFADYRERKARHTLRRQDAGLALFAEYLSSKNVPTQGEELATVPDTWRGITWGILEGFKRWQLQQGYAVSSINVRLSTIRVYAGLAAKAGIIDTEDYALIRNVEGYSRKEAKRIDEQRAEAGLETRVGAKKAEPVSLTQQQVKQLKAQPGTPQGRRDAVLLTLLLDLGLRVSEVAGLTVGNVNLKDGELTFYRQKVDKVQTHKLVGDSLDAMRNYMAQDAPAVGLLLRASDKSGRLTDIGLTARAITERVRVLGEAVGVEGLSAHDCRHYWATAAARAGTQVDRLMDAGGWSSPAMPVRYIEAAKIANEGVKLG